MLLLIVLLSRFLSATAVGNLIHKVFFNLSPKLHTAKIVSTHRIDCALMECDLENTYSDRHPAISLAIRTYR